MQKIIKVNADNPEKERIKEAAEILKKGGLVAFPTETVYGLAALHNNSAAMEKLYEVKNRPKQKPFTVHISKLEMVELLGCEMPYLAKMLIDRFWPGPLTIVLNVKDGKGTLAFRMPDNKICKELIDTLGVPIVAPSANLSGEKSPRSAEDVLKGLSNKIDAVVDGGQTRIGIDSTIIDATSFPYRILRKGAIRASVIKDTWHLEGQA